MPTKTNTNHILDTAKGAYQEATAKLPVLTPEEKKLLRRFIQTTPAEREALLSKAILIHAEKLRAYEEEKDECAMQGLVYTQRSSRWSEEWLNNGAFFVVVDYDGRVYRAATFKRLTLLLKALKKDVQLRYDKEGLTIKR